MEDKDLVPLMEYAILLLERFYQLTDESIELLKGEVK